VTRVMLSTTIPVPPRHDCRLLRDRLLFHKVSATNRRGTITEAGLGAQLFPNVGQERFFMNQEVLFADADTEWCLSAVPPSAWLPRFRPQPTVMTAWRSCGQIEVRPRAAWRNLHVTSPTRGCPPPGDCRLGQCHRLVLRGMVGEPDGRAMMRSQKEKERAVGAILDLMVSVLRAHEGNDPTLKEMKEYCRQACRIVAGLRKPPRKKRCGVRHTRGPHVHPS
jgi:hypothetical protein